MCQQLWIFLPICIKKLDFQLKNCGKYCLPTVWATLQPSSSCSCFHFYTLNSVWKKGRLWQINNPPFPFYSAAWVLSHWPVPLCGIQLISPLLNSVWGFLFVHFCFILQRENWEYWNISWGKKKESNNSIRSNEWIFKKKVYDLKWRNSSLQEITWLW